MYIYVLVFLDDDDGHVDCEVFLDFVSVRERFLNVMSQLINLDGQGDESFIVDSYVPDEEPNDTDMALYLRTVKDYEVFALRRDVQ